MSIELRFMMSYAIEPITTNPPSPVAPEIISFPYGLLKKINAGISTNEPRPITKATQVSITRMLLPALESLVVPLPPKGFGIAWARPGTADMTIIIAIFNATASAGRKRLIVIAVLNAVLAIRAGMQLTAFLSVKKFAFNAVFFIVKLLKGTRNIRYDRLAAPETLYNKVLQK